MGAVTALALIVSAVWSVGLAVPAHAASPITIYSPSGEEYPAGEPITVTGFNGSDSTGGFWVYCNNRPTRSIFVDPGSFSEPLGSFTVPDSCQIEDYFSGDLLATFTVGGPATTVSDATVSLDTFYPLVRDRYQDSVKFRWRQDDVGRATITVTSASTGRVVRTATPSAWQGRNDWTWNGLNADGDPVAKGRYRIAVRVNANSVFATVKVNSKIVTRTFAQRKEGNQGVQFSTRGNCYASRDSYNQLAYLDCWSGRYAKARYRLRVPANAFDVRGKVDLLRNDSDICCRGRISKGWSRPSKRTVVLWAQVTDLRATTVNFVRLTYKAKVRI